MLTVEGLRKSYRARDGSPVEALREVSFALAEGEALGVVGPSGSGKTTLARCLLGLEQPDGGKIRLRGREWLSLSGKALRRERRRVQAVFQDPFASLNPLWPVRRIIGEPLRIAGVEAGSRHEKIAELAAAVGLAADLLDRRPEALSGGQRQRVAIARALTLDPELLIADEPTSALDAAVRLQILELISDLRGRRRLAVVLITHDLSAVRDWCDRAVVLVAGRLVESGPAATLCRDPRHPWTRWLLNAATASGREWENIGRPPPEPVAAGWVEVDPGHRVLQAPSD